MERTVNIPAHLLLDAEIIRLGRERAEIVRGLRNSLHDAQIVAENLHDKLDEKLMFHTGGDSVFEVKLSAINTMAVTMDIQLSFEKVAYKWQVKLRYDETPRTCTSMTLPLPDAPRWVEDLWDAIVQARDAQRAVQVQVSAAEAAAHGRQVQEDATLIVAQRLVPM